MVSIRSRQPHLIRRPAKDTEKHLTATCDNHLQDTSPTIIGRCANYRATRDVIAYLNCSFQILHRCYGIATGRPEASISTLVYLRNQGTQGTHEGHADSGCVAKGMQGVGAACTYAVAVNCTEAVTFTTMELRIMRRRAGRIIPHERSGGCVPSTVWELSRGLA